MWYSALGCIVTLILGLLMAATAHAQPPANVPRIGYLVTAGLASPETRVLLDAFRQGLRERGYVEGQNIVIEYRAADGKLERFPALAAELVQLKPEVIVAQGTPAALAAKAATTSIPIVTPVMGDPVGATGLWPASHGQAGTSRG
jgi:putative tryptophan/tyrosine transport system substrate-binding protein